MPPSAPGKQYFRSFVVITLAALALEITDQLAIGIIQAAGETTTTMGDKIILLAAGLTGINVTAPGVGAIVTIFLGGLMVAAVAIVWFSLLIRKALATDRDRPRAARVRRGRVGCQPLLDREMGGVRPRPHRVQASCWSWCS